MPTRPAQTYMPRNDVRVTACEFTWTSYVIGTYPVRWHSTDGNDVSSSGCHQLWVEKSQAWCRITKGDFIVHESDGVGFYPCTREEFIAKYEEVPS